MYTFGPEESLDLLRTLRMASFGLLISGPTLHFWFNFVSKVFPKKDVVTTLKKMFLGQAVYGPIINSVFFSYNAALQGSVAIISHCFLLDSLKLFPGSLVLLFMYFHLHKTFSEFLFFSWDLLHLL
jgi:hypothetical protein